MATVEHRCSKCYSAFFDNNLNVTICMSCNVPMLREVEFDADEFEGVDEHEFEYRDIGVVD